MEYNTQIIREGQDEQYIDCDGVALCIEHGS